MSNNKARIMNKTRKQPSGLVFFPVVEKMLQELPERGRDILMRRYGLVGDYAIQTLEQIGQDYGITRERVRQIISDYRKILLKRCQAEDIVAVEKKILFTIEKKYGIIRETEAISRLNPAGLKQEENAIRFLLECSKNINLVPEKGLFEKSWLSAMHVLEKAEKVILEVEEVLKKENRPLLDEEITIMILGQDGDASRKDEILSFLDVSLRVKKNNFGKRGIHNWPEIKPKGSREKIYLILKESNKPLHFKEIATLIDSYGLGEKKTHPQTIHNELIKDVRFVLIGRGIYALAEWGYYKGAIKDVLVNILKSSDKPINKEQIIKEAFKARRVKKTTVMINLNNSDLFVKSGDHYSLKK